MDPKTKAGKSDKDSAVSRSTVRSGSMPSSRAFARVLTLVVVTKAGLEEEAIEAANDARGNTPAGSAAPNRLDALRWWASAAGRGRTRISPPK